MAHSGYSKTLKVTVCIQKCVRAIMKYKVHLTTERTATKTAMKYVWISIGTQSNFSMHNNCIVLSTWVAWFSNQWKKLATISLLRSVIVYNSSFTVCVSSEDLKLSPTTHSPHVFEIFASINGTWQEYVMFIKLMYSILVGKCEGGEVRPVLLAQQTICTDAKSLILPKSGCGNQPFPCREKYPKSKTSVNWKVGWSWGDGGQSVGGLHPWHWEW